MNKRYLLPIIMFLLAASLAAAIPLSFTVKASGEIISVTENITVIEKCIPNSETNVTECVNETIITNLTSSEPWSDSSSVEVDCSASCTYPMPSFDIPEGAEVQKYVVRTSSEAVILFDSTKSQSTNKSSDKIIVEVAKKSSQMVVERISPSSIKEGISQLNIFATNNGSATISYFNVSIIGAGVIDAFAETNDPLEPGELGIVPVIVNASGAGQKEMIVKISWTDSGKILSSIYVTSITVTPGDKPSVQINSTEVTARFNSDKERLRTYESEYTLKKAQGYLVAEVYDSIKDAKDNVATIQLLLEEGKFSEAKSKLALLELSLEDVENGLKNALKTQQTWADRLKNNALLISAIVTALVGIISLYERQRMKLKSLKEKIAQKKIEKEKLNTKSKKKPKKQKPKKEEVPPLPEITTP